MKIMMPLGTGSNWQNNELRYMLRSIEQNLKGDYEIEIYGDAPEWVTNVKVVKIERYYPQWLRENKQKEKKGLDYENFFDTLNKVKMFSETNEGKFLYMYDDVLLIKETDINDIQNIPLEIELPKYYITREHEKHGRTINRAVGIFSSFFNGYRPTIYNYETHLPRVYNCNSLRCLFEKHDFSKLEIPYALATLYFNCMPDEATKDISIVKDIKAGFYFDDEGVASYLSDSMFNIENAIANKIWVNYTDKGLEVLATDGSGNKYLKEWIMNKFNKKSKYEKD